MLFLELLLYYLRVFHLSLSLTQPRGTLEKARSLSIQTDSKILFTCLHVLNTYGHQVKASVLATELGLTEVCTEGGHRIWGYLLGLLLGTKAESCCQIGKSLP